MKSMHAADSSAKAITGSTRTHIISRLQKAKKNATHLLGLLKEKATSSESQMMLEARAYYSMLLGTQKFEAQKWEASLRAYSESHIIYSFLAKSSSGNHGDIFRELLTNTVDPSIRYATYQLRLPRTLSILKIVARFIPKDSELSQSILEKDPGLLNEGSIVTKAGITDDTRDLPKTISWGKRIVKLEHANIAQALAAVSAAEQRLALLLSSATDMSSADKAAAYESVLDPSQDAVNATKMAIDELLADGVAQGDPRMQALQITRTAVGYALIGWRIGRNRVLSGRSDGAYLEPENNRKKSKQGGVPKDAAVKEESSGRKIIRLRERVVLYDNTLQSLESIKDLPGVAADQELLEELGVKRAYFASLRYVGGKKA
jgi:signal recognition particle subunit SRP68